MMAFELERILYSTECIHCILYNVYRVLGLSPTWLSCGYFFCRTQKAPSKHVHYLAYIGVRVKPK